MRPLAVAPQDDGKGRNERECARQSLTCVNTPPVAAAPQDDNKERNGRECAPVKVSLVQYDPLTIAPQDDRSGTYQDDGKE